MDFGAAKTLADFGPKCKLWFGSLAVRLKLLSSNNNLRFYKREAHLDAFGSPVRCSMVWFVSLWWSLVSARETLNCANLITLIIYLEWRCKNRLI